MDDLDLALSINRWRCLVDGRPVEVIRNNSSIQWHLRAATVRVHHENGVNHCQVDLSKSDALLSDDEIRRRFVKPMLATLDRGAFPEREKSLMEAISARVEELRQANALRMGAA